MLKVRLKSRNYLLSISTLLMAASWIFLPFLRVERVLLGEAETGSEYSLYESATVRRINKNPIYPCYEVIFAVEGYKVTSKIQLKRTLFDFKIMSQSDIYLIEQE